MSSQQPQPPRNPLSPWAERFGSSGEAYWASKPDNLRHSGIAPKFPDLDPVSYSYFSAASPDEKINTIAKPSNEELDDLFYSERYQQIVLTGLKSWQAGVLNESVFPNKESGHAKWHQRESKPNIQYSSPDPLDTNRIVPNESTWFECFKRHRWLVPEDEGPQAKEVTNWTVDDDVIWDNLSISLELANRMLSRLLVDQNRWFDAVLNSDQCMWYADVGPGGSLQFVPKGGTLEPDTKIGLKYRQPSARADSATLRKLFEAATEKVLWSFTDEFDADADHANADAWGLTSQWYPDPSKKADHLVFIRVSVNTLRGICNGSLTLAERCMGWFQLAATIMHELMHAIWYEVSQVNGEPICGNAFMAGEYIAEMGWSMEAEVFGGIVGEVAHKRRGDFWYNGSFLSMFLEEFPNDFRARDLEQTNSMGFAVDLIQGQFPPPGHAQTRNLYHASMYWVSAMLSEAFWRDIVPSHGSRAFRFPKQLFMRQPWQENATERNYSLRTMKLEGDLDDKMRQKLEGISRKFDLHERQMRTIRPWYDAEYQKWQVSAWSSVYARTQITNFCFHAARRDYEKAAESAVNLSMAARNSAQQAKTVKTLEPLTYWIFLVISQMMWISLPSTIVTGKDGPKSNRSYWMSQLMKSRAPAFPNNLTFPMTAPRVAKGVTTIPYHNVPLHFATMARATIQQHESRFDPAPLEWITSMKTALQDMANKRGIAIANVHEWVPFTFKVPNYNPDPSWVTLAGPGELQKSYETQIYTSCNVSPLRLEGFLPSPKRGGKMVPRKVRSATGGGLVEVTDAPTKYFTIAEVADAGSFHIAEPNEDGTLDVYDITDIVLDMPIYSTYTPIACQEAIIYSKDGRQLDNSPVAGEIRRIITRDPQPLGKVLQWIRAEEVAEYDGTDGKPLYVTLRGHVFNITDFPFAIGEQALFTNNPGGPIELETSGERSVYDMFQRLLPYRCGLIMPVGRTPPTEDSLRTYTLTELRGHDNPTHGIYVAINGYVYDITGYADYHPAGCNIIKTVAGRDATSEFAKYHSPDLLNQTNYAALKIGRIVPEIELTDLGAYEVALHDWVFDIAQLGRSNAMLYNTVQQFRGTDATSWLTSTSSTALAVELAKLYLGHEKLIVASLRREITLPEISLSVLTEKNNAGIDGGAWVAVGSDVYDVTTIIRHHDSYDNAPPLNRRMAGTVLTTYADTMNWLQDTQRHRVVATLAAGGSSTATTRKRTYSHSV